MISIAGAVSYFFHQSEISSSVRKGRDPKSAGSTHVLTSALVKETAMKTLLIGEYASTCKVVE